MEPYFHHGIPSCPRRSCYQIPIIPAYTPKPAVNSTTKPTNRAYGYTAFEGNYYWVPGSQRQEVKILQYSDRLKIYLARECLAEYPLPADGVTNQRFSPRHGWISLA